MNHKKTLWLHPMVRKQFFKKATISSLKQLSVVIALIILSGCKQPQTKLRIATAASMQYTMQRLTESFTLQTGIPCDIVTGSSGKLTTQITQGAPYDVFVAADMKYPRTVFDNRMAVSTPKTYAYGNLVLWSTKPEIPPSLQTLHLSTIKHIALANPKTAPYGQAALEVLKRTSLLDSLSTKLVYGESVAQASQFIFSGAADIGFTAKSIVVASGLKNKGHWVPVNQKLYTPIAQGIVLLKADNKQQEQAKKFYNFMFSDAATAILNTFGYSRTKP